MKHKAQVIDIQVSQGTLKYADSSSTGLPVSMICQVTDVHSDRLACDVVTPDGQTLRNVPIITQAGLQDGKPYGTAWFPNIKDHVVLLPVAYGRRYAILGTVVPYLTDSFIDNTVNSDDKAFTKKLLEEGKKGHYKKIFKSGTSLEVTDDGTLIIETPSGRYIKMDETNNQLKVIDSPGNTIVIGTDGISIEDKNGNTISMETGKTVINGNLEVSQ